MKKIFTAVLTLHVIFCQGQTSIVLNPAQGLLKDALVANQTPNQNWANHQNTEATTWTCSSVLCNGRTLIQFDFSGIPQGSIINSAELFLYADINAINCSPGQPTYGMNNNGFIRKITQAWSENTVTWNNQPTFTSTGEIPVPASTGTAQDYVIDMTSMVQDFVSNPSTDFGFIIMLADEFNYYKSLIFGSNDHSDTSLRPQMVINYSTPLQECVEFILNDDGYDVLLSNEYPNNNYLIHESNELITWTCSSVLCNGRSLIRFDLSSIPQNSLVDSAFIELFANVNNHNGVAGSPTYGVNNTGLIQKVTQPWNQNTVTWNTQPASTSTNQVTVPHSNSNAQDQRLDVLTLVRDMVSNPGSNYGFLLRQQDEINYYNSQIFSSGEDPDPAKRPRLKVCFRTTTGLNDNEGQNFTSVKLYPNPMADHAILEFNFKQANTKIIIDIFDITGRILGSHHLLSEVSQHNTFSISRRNLVKGIYLIKLSTENGDISCHKLIVE
jgi:hypothetical protein